MKTIQTTWKYMLILSNTWTILWSCAQMFRKKLPHRVREAENATEFSLAVFLDKCHLMEIKHLVAGSRKFFHVLPKRSGGIQSEWRWLWVVRRWIIKRCSSRSWCFITSFSLKRFILCIGFSVSCRIGGFRPLDLTWGSFELSGSF